MSDPVPSDGILSTQEEMRARFFEKIIKRWTEYEFFFLRSQSYQEYLKDWEEEIKWLLPHKQTSHGTIMKTRYKKRTLYRRIRPQYVSAQALKGMIRKPAKPVSIEAMSEAIASELHKNWTDQELVRKDEIRRSIQLIEREEWRGSE